MVLEELQQQVDKLHLLYGEPGLMPICGAGCVRRPEVCFVFMNPTARNVASDPGWKGLRAPWLGTKNVWPMFYELGFLSERSFVQIQKMRPAEWTAEFASALYRELAHKKVYITNLAKCTQSDARPLSDSVFKKYLTLMHEELLLTRPRRIVTFGNQVSSILLGRAIRVSSYSRRDKELLFLRSTTFSVYPTFYPVGQGRRNMPKAIQRIRATCCV